ncbi:uncharacterized protein PF3D7_1120000-like isoform X2 [Hyperolius riggenbachi]|uniref:uncharacterized protein PF3D7_1120000-like isoform X2 n=1 Tax=Hyperolius riggenbachi TaxID=752182 RepID=UPI0035A273E2
MSRPWLHRDTDGLYQKGLPHCETCASLRATINQMEKDKEEALQVQQKSFQKQLADIARNRKHLEEERVAILRHKLQLEMEQSMQEIRQSWGKESTEALQEACQEVRREAETEREKAIREVKAEAELYYKERVKVAVREAVVEEQRKEEEQKEELRRQQAEELHSFKEKICTVQEQLKKVVGEKMDFESRFQETAEGRELSERVAALPTPPSERQPHLSPNPKGRRYLEALLG